MTHKLKPFAHRLGTIRTWTSKWSFSQKDDYKNHLKTDHFVREYLEKELRKGYVSSIEFSRNLKDEYNIKIRTSRPGVIAGKDNAGIEKLVKGIKRVIRKNNLKEPKKINIDLETIKRPYQDAGVVVAEIIEQLEKRMPFRRVMKTMLQNVMNERNVKGAKISISGRLNGADMARKEFVKDGRIPLSTIRADVDYREGRANLPYGVLGIKVWIYKGDIFNK